MLAEGILVSTGNRLRPKLYKFFGHSPNQLRNRTCVLYDSEKLNFKDVVRAFGKFYEIHNVAKQANRIGLLLSTAEPTVELAQDEFEVISDVENSNEFNSYNFTDGCGFISYETAKHIAEYLEIDFRYVEQNWKVPSVFEIQFQSYKGLLALHPKLDEKQDSKIRIQVRPSLKKFTWTKLGPSPLCVVDGVAGVSRPYSYCALDERLMRHLSALGVSENVFMSKQKSCFDDLKKLMSDRWLQIMFLSLDPQCLNLVDRLLATSRIDDDTSTALKKIRSEAGRRMAGIGEPLTIPIERSRKVYGICDPTGELKYGSCFFQPTIRGEPQIFNGNNVFVAKIPCYHPGDIRVLKCVNVRGCEHLVDCVVFPVRGKRPHSDEIAGSNLGGDKYMICWDQELVPHQHDKATAYSDSPTETQQLISQNDLLNHFCDHRDVSSKLDCIYENWSQAKGVRSPECLLIASLFKAAVDSAETGKYVKIPNFLYKMPEPKTDDMWAMLVENARQYLANDIRIKIQDDCLTCPEEDLLMLLEMSNSGFEECELQILCHEWCSQNECNDMLHTFLKYIKNCEPVYGTHSSLKLQLDSSSILKNRDVNLINDIFPMEWVCFYHKYDLRVFPFQLLNNVLTTDMQKLILFKVSMTNEDFNVGFFSGNAENDRNAKLFVSFRRRDTRKIIFSKFSYNISLDQRSFNFYDDVIGEVSKPLCRIVQLGDDATTISLSLDKGGSSHEIHRVMSVEMYVSSEDANSDVTKTSLLDNVQQTLKGKVIKNNMVRPILHDDGEFPRPATKVRSKRENIGVCPRPGRKVKWSNLDNVDPVLKSFYENPSDEMAVEILRQIRNGAQVYNL
ncbi:Uncharacterised protein r2_g989 [Pycnogonum litorale]